MIDWSETESKLGRTDLDGKRPIVICACDGCGKRREIAIRVKSRVINNQMTWHCPSCVCLGRSDNISAQMRDCWADDVYRNNQLEHKADDAYKTLQGEKSRKRWGDDAYRSKLETGIDIEAYTANCEQKFPGQFVYDKSSLVNWKNKITIKCVLCGMSFRRLPLTHLQTGSCPVCKLPGDLRNFIPSGYDLNDRTTISPLELDIYWKEHKIALEYHGLYWHSYCSPETVAEKTRHQVKALKCAENNIKLYQFFDFEWYSKCNIVKSMINNLFGKSLRIGARHLKLLNLDHQTAREFFNKNHLQSHRPAGITIGLVSNADIIMAASFSKHHDGYEIIRMATKLGYQVPGGVSRIIAEFRRSTNKPIYTFADMRYSVGNSYKAIGFKELHVTKPNYFYYKSNTFLSRQQCQKHKLSKLLNNFNELLSEPENMFMNGYRRVWDAGHMKLKLS